jgi:phosphatidylcholine synthase
MHFQSYTTRNTAASHVNHLSAWLVHLYTASGAIAAFSGVVAVFGSRYREAFLWMVAATVIDATDGVLARRARVKQVLPAVDGAKLDDIVDYLTFVFAPAYLVFHAQLAPEGLRLVVAAAMLLSSAYGFSQATAKTADHFFTGFPSYWNIVAFYLVALAPPPWVCAGVVIGLAVLVFVPVVYVYPSRTPTLRALTIALGLAWAACMLAMIWLYPAIPRLVLYLSLGFPAYYFVLSLVLDARRRRSTRM